MDQPRGHILLITILIHLQSLLKVYRLRRHQGIIFNDIMSVYMDKIKIKFSFINKFSTFNTISFLCIFMLASIFSCILFLALFLSSLVSIDESILQRLFNFLCCLRAILQSVLNQGLEEIQL